MNQWLLLFMVMILLVFPAYGGIVNVNSPRDGFLALRSEPNVTTGVRLVKIPHATALTLGECQTTADHDTWCRTSYGQKTGWISKRYVVPQHDTGPKPEPGSGAWRIGPEGFGPIKVGMAQAEAEKLLGQKLQHNDSWSDECFFTQVNVAMGAASLQVMDQRVVVVVIGEHHRASSVGGGIVTSEGIRVGDTLAQVDKAYRGVRGFTRKVDRGYEDDYPAVVYWDSGRSRGIAFVYNPRNQRVSEIRAGTRSIYARHEGCG
jgi:hypothetical protein